MTSWQFGMIVTVTAPLIVGLVATLAHHHRRRRRGATLWDANTREHVLRQKLELARKFMHEELRITEAKGLNASPGKQK